MKSKWGKAANIRAVSAWDFLEVEVETLPKLLLGLIVDCRRQNVL
jgi:hypothetical protein